MSSVSYHLSQITHNTGENYPSQNLLKKLGFSFETVRKGFMLENNKWTDKAVFYRNLN